MRRIIQATTDPAITQNSTVMLCNGDINGQKFFKIIGVGQDYGSVQTRAASVTFLNVLDKVSLACSFILPCEILLPTMIIVSESDRRPSFCLLLGLTLSLNKCFQTVSQVMSLNII